MQKIGTENAVCPTTEKSKWTKEIHYNMNDKESKTPHTRTVLQNTFIYFALNWINLPFHPDPPLSNCHDLTYQAADSNAMQMQLCNFLNIFLYLIDTFSCRWYIFSSHVEKCFLRLILQKEPARQILGKQFLHHSYPWTISRLTASSLLFNCILHENKSQCNMSWDKYFARQCLLWAFCFLHFIQCIEIFRKCALRSDWKTEWER